MMNMMTTSKSTETLRHECQICAGYFTAKGGLLSKHGYKRPGDGFLHGECFGARRRSYLLGTDALVEYRALIANMLAGAKEYAAKLSADAPVFTRHSMGYAKDENGRIIYSGRRAQMVPVMTEMVPGVTNLYTYLDALKYERLDRNARVRVLADEVARVDARIAAAPKSV